MQRGRGGGRGGAYAGGGAGRAGPPSSTMMPVQNMMDTEDQGGAQARGMKPPIPTYVEISGYLQGDHAELLPFIKSKASKAIHVVKELPCPRSTIWLLGNKAMAHAVQDLSGIFYHHEKLYIRMVSEETVQARLAEAAAPHAPNMRLASVGGADACPDSSGQSGSKEEKRRAIMHQLLTSLYDANLRYLNLSRLAGAVHERVSGLPDAPAVAGLLKGLEDWNHSRLGANLWMGAVAAGFAETRALNLAGNGLWTLRNLAFLATWLPALHNVSLEDNKLAKWSDLDALKRCEVLEEVILLGNPLLPRASLFDLDALTDYFKNGLQLIPRLKYLDRVLIASYPCLHQQPQAPPSTVRPSFFDATQTSQIVEAWLLRFFESIDKARHLLGDVYAADCVMEIASLTHSRSGRMDARPEALQQGALWMEYLRQNYQQLQLWDLSVAAETAHGQAAAVQLRGRDLIGAFYGRDLGHTKHVVGPHDLAVPGLPPMPFTPLLVDAWQDLHSRPGQPALYILLQGYMLHAPAAPANAQTQPVLPVPVLYRRLLVLAPNMTPGSAWPAIIQRDLLFMPAGTLALGPTAAPVHVAPADRALLDELPELKRQLVLDFSAKTRLRLPLAKQCLADNAWSVGDATKAFNLLKSKRAFPKDAFLP